MSVTSLAPQPRRIFDCERPLRLCRSAASPEALAKQLVAPRNNRNIKPIDKDHHQVLLLDSQEDRLTSDKTTNLSIKMPEAPLERVNKLVKSTGITRHNLLLRLINLGLSQAEIDVTALLSPAARTDESEK